MRIVHISFDQIYTCRDGAVWLDKISFFTGIIEAMTAYNEVHSIHCIVYEGKIIRNGATYHFVEAQRPGLGLPVKVRALLKALNPDIIIIHGLHRPWYTLLTRLILKDNAEIFIQHHAEKPFRPPKSFLQRIADRRVKGYFFSSKELSNEWIRRKQIVSEAKVHQVMEASSGFQPIEKGTARQLLGLTDEDVYLWVGRIDENKDPNTLIRAFNKFTISHSGKFLYVIFKESNVQQLATIKELAQLNSNIIFVGHVEHAQMLCWYSASDFIVSTSHYEGSGISVCEALSCGCIPILSDIPSFRMMTNHGSIGLLFEPGDSVSLANALIRSVGINRSSERVSVLQQFKDKLSFEAIARDISNIVTS